MENEFLMVFKTVGMGTTIWSPLASGLLSGKYNDGIPEESRFAITGFDWLKDRWMKESFLDKVKRLNDLAKSLGITLAQLCIAWCIKNPDVTTAILGANRKEQLLENLMALEATGKLTKEIMHKIDEIVKTKPVLPEY
jgi:aryl-alcohol dehydrogenase-like predicted oxidoreductase